MIITNGFNNKETTIKISNGKKDDRKAEVWIDQTGSKEKETLSYITLSELLDLKDEIEKTIKEIINI